MNEKVESRQRRARKSRVRMRTARVTRLTVHRTPRHIYAQVIGPEGDRVLASASTLDKDLRSGATGNIDAAARWERLLLSALKRLALPRWPLIALDSSTTVGSRRWRMPRVKADWSFKHGV